MKSNKILAIFASLLILMMCLSAVSAAVATGEHNTNTIGIDNNDDIDINDEPGNDDIYNVTADNDNDDFDNVTNEKLATHILTDVNPFGSKVISSQLEDENSNPLANKNIEITLHNGTGAIVDMKNMQTDSSGVINYDISNLKAGNYQVSICFPGDDKYEASGDTQDFTVEGGKSGKLATHFNTDVEPFGYKVVSSQLCDENSNTLSGRTVKFTLYDKNGAVIDSESKTTNDDGCAEYDTSKLKNGTYKLGIVFDGDNQHKACSDMVTLNIGDSGNPIDMQNTGVPLIILACAILGLIGVGYKKYNK